MFKSIFKTTLRNILKNKVFTLINLLGLVIAFLSFIIIKHYVKYESNFDRFQPDGEKIYRISLKLFEDGKLSYESARAYGAIAPSIKTEIPEVEDACRITPIPQLTLSNKDADKQFIERKACYADTSFLKMFAVEFLKGNSKTALSNSFKVVLSESMAKKYFADKDPIGKILSWNDQFELEVTGVFKDYPEQSHVQFDFLISYPSIFETRKILSNGQETIDYSNVSWTWYIFYTYVKFKDGTNVEEFNNKLNQLYIKYSDRRVEGVRWAEFVLTPLQNIYLDSHLPLEFKNSGSRTALIVLNLTSFLILLIAWINYINMATNRSLERAKEVGIRKVHGSGQVQLIFQFIIESLSINFLALIASVLLAFPLLNFMNELIGMPKSYNLLSNLFFWNELLLVLIIGTFLSGFYPAFVISRFKPILVLKGKFKNSKSSLVLRKGLAIVQFIVSFLLIVATILIYKQINFMQNQPLGFEIEQTLVITSPRSGNENEFEVRKQTFRQKLKEYPAIKEIAASTYTPGMPITWSLSSRWTRTPAEATQTLYCMQADSNYFNLYKIPFIEGRNFQINDVNKGVLNETALALLGFENAESAMHETVLVWTDSIEIVGVVKDYHQQGLEKSLYPMIFMSNPNRRGYYSIKVENNNWADIISNIEKQWKEIYPADPFEYSFLDEQFNRQYQNHIKFGKILTIFSALSIFISCLGLYVFASYNVLQRLKEIGIRKVLGANNFSIYLIFLKEFLLVIVLGLTISIPILIYSSHKWLSQFAYKTSLSFADFVIAFVLVLLLVLGTITFKIYKATLVNAASILKQE